MKPATVLQASERPSEDERIRAAFKNAAEHARKQLASQGLKLPTQDWKLGKIRNPVL